MNEIESEKNQSKSSEYENVLPIQNSFSFKFIPHEREFSDLKQKLEFFLLLNRFHNFDTGSIFVYFVLYDYAKLNIM